MANLLSALNRYISLVASMCMVLYGYDASVFNAAQGSDHWLEWFDLDLVRCDLPPAVLEGHCKRSGSGTQVP